MRQNAEVRASVQDQCRKQPARACLKSTRLTRAQARTASGSSSSRLPWRDRGACSLTAPRCQHAPCLGRSAPLHTVNLNAWGQAPVAGRADRCDPSDVDTPGALGHAVSAVEILLRDTNKLVCQQGQQDHVSNIFLVSQSHHHCMAARPLLLPAGTGRHQRVGRPRGAPG